MIILKTKYITDKLAHFLGGFFIATVFQFLGVLMIVPAIKVGLLKEMYDKYYKKTKFDWYDLVSTVAGGVVAYLVKLAYS